MKSQTETVKTLEESRRVHEKSQSDVYISGSSSPTQPSIGSPPSTLTVRPSAVVASRGLHPAPPQEHACSESHRSSGVRVSTESSPEQEGEVVGLLLGGSFIYFPGKSEKSAHFATF